MHSPVLAEERATLAARLRERRPEIERAITSLRIGRGDPNDARGSESPFPLADALDSVIAWMANVEGDIEAEGLPAALLDEVTEAARSGVGLDTTLRRFVAVGAAASEFVLYEAADLPRASQRALQRDQRLHLDRTLAEVADAYRAVGLEGYPRALSVAEWVERAIAGDDAAARRLGYPVDGWNLGVIARGAGASETLASLAADCALQLLAVPREGGLVWVWFGSLERARVARLGCVAADRLPPDVSLVMGEVHRGLDGWRRSHHQARAGLEVMMHRPGQLTRSSAVAPLAGLLVDDVLAALMRDTYLRPLRAADPGARIRRTLRAYVDTSLNAASTSATLGIDRSTVQRHLRRAEDCLGRQLDSCFVELKLALELEDLEATE
jgi:hypothetical protein